jgi:predicted RNase H-like HicB family nuclease
LTIYTPFYGNPFKAPQEDSTMRYHAVLSQEKDWIVAVCPEVDVASEGKTVEEAMKNLKEAVELYLEDEDVESLPIKKVQVKTLEIVP